MATLEQVTYDLALHALDEQAQTVAGLRLRTGPVLALIAAVAALGLPALSEAGPLAQVSGWGGVLCAGLGFVFALQVLSPGELSFAVDSVALYESAEDDRDDPDVFYLRLAQTLRDMRLDNEAAVEGLRTAYSALLGAVVLESVLLGLAAALG